MFDNLKIRSPWIFRHTIFNCLKKFGDFNCQEMVFLCESRETLRSCDEMCVPWLAFRYGYNWIWNIETNFNIVELLELFLIWDFESWNLEKNLRKPKAKISLFWTRPHLTRFSIVPHSHMRHMTQVLLWHTSQYVI